MTRVIVPVIIRGCTPATTHPLASTPTTGIPFKRHNETVCTWPHTAHIAIQSQAWAHDDLGLSQLLHNWLQWIRLSTIIIIWITKLDDRTTSVIIITKTITKYWMLLQVKIWLFNCYSVFKLKFHDFIPHSKMYWSTTSMKIRIVSKYVFS